MSELRSEPYEPEMSAECIALERACPQGTTYRLSFVRRAFHLRAQSFADWQILVASDRHRIVGTVAWALKSLLVRGQTIRSAFLFDLRVHPEWRRRGVASLLTRQVFEQIRQAGVEMRYTYCIDDNLALRRLAELFDAAAVGSYRYLVWPVYRERIVAETPVPVSAAEVHGAQLAANGPFDFYCDPLAGGRLQGHQGSFMRNGAGCSVWSNAGLLEEVVEAIPGYYGMAGRILRSWPLNRARWPHIPVPAEILRSWYVFDFFATSAEAARELMHHVNNRALASGIDYCYIIHLPGQAWVTALKADTPWLFSPVISYCLLASSSGGSLQPFKRPYVDIRDL